MSAQRYRRRCRCCLVVVVVMEEGKGCFASISNTSLSGITTIIGARYAIAAAREKLQKPFGMRPIELPMSQLRRGAGDQCLKLIVEGGMSGAGSHGAFR
ncbi:uncharacterized protein EI97DRAFT_127335 [Westerdykella ornata]|uniref:Uncharacterized protein n=1 Tax=Westerdykella ornata TaxID=318751 RepID=A0A6A6JDQ2_WESOR|nr:uncharacterized protein EI97DRAFT_127335 [Westerdykella ornata]KAF2274364.1 hypothetical protein EI97DRAFT_127335 [Westerdykella ornata]